MKVFTSSRVAASIALLIFCFSYVVGFQGVVEDVAEGGTRRQMIDASGSLRDATTVISNSEVSFSLVEVPGLEIDGV